MSASAVMAVMLLTGYSSLDMVSNATQDSTIQVAPTLQTGFRDKKGYQNG